MLASEVQTHDVEVRTALALAAATQCPVTIENVGGASGIGRRHLAWARAAAAVCGGTAQGALGMSTLEFEPGAVASGQHEVAIGVGRSAVELAWVVLPAALTAPGAVDVLVRGATHTVDAPGAGWLVRSLAPRLETLGRSVTAEVEQTGFAPGSGKLRLRVGAVGETAHGYKAAEGAVVLVAHLTAAVGEREAAQLAQAGFACRVIEAASSSPGNAIALDVLDGKRREVFTACGQRGVSGAELVETQLARACAWRESGADLSCESGDAWLVALALGGGGEYTVPGPSPNTARIAEIVEKFIDVEVSLRVDGSLTRIEVRP